MMTASKYVLILITALLLNLVEGELNQPNLAGSSRRLAKGIGPAAKEFTISISNKSGVTRKVFIASAINGWERTLEPGQSGSFLVNRWTLFYMRDYISGTRFDIYGGRAPTLMNNNIELYDTFIIINGRSVKHVELKQNNGL